MLQCDGAQSDVDKLALFLLATSRRGKSCKACQAWTRAAAAQLVDSVDDSFDHAGTVTDPTKMRHHLCGKSGQKRRYDEDFKRAVSSEILVKKRAVSITSFAHATDQLNYNTAMSWDHDSLSWYQAAMWANMDTVKDISITMDASRIGQPALDLMMYAVFL